MNSNSFTKKQIYFDIKNTRDIITIKDFLAYLKINCDGLPSINSANIRIYGLDRDMMDRLSFIQYRGQDVSSCSIDCYYNGSLIFSGDITNAYPDFSKVPDVSFYILSLTNYRQLVKPIRPTSMKGEQTMDTIVSTIVKDMKGNYIVINSGVNIADSNIYLEGSNIQKLIKLSEDYNFDLIINENSIVIADYDKPTNDIILIDCNEDRVMGYIQITQDGIQLEIYTLNLEYIWVLL